MEQVNISTIIPNDNKSINKGGILPLNLNYKNFTHQQIEYIALKYNFDLSSPIKQIPKEGLNAILYGCKDRFSHYINELGFTKEYEINFEGICNLILSSYHDQYSSANAKKWAAKYIDEITCNACNGNRLNKEALYFKIANKNIAEVVNLDILELYEFISNIDENLTKKQYKIAYDILKELKMRTQFLLDIGLDYISLGRGSKTLSGGEAQRIRLASQIGSKLTGILYILDEPSIGLHQRDNTKLITSLKKIRDIGNSVIVVEHDKEIMQESDYIIDMGPKAGKNGGEVIACGTYNEILKYHTPTSSYLKGEKNIEILKNNTVEKNKSILLKGALGNNLKNIDVEFPLRRVICVTGVSGSGKSTLINETLYPILSQKIYRSHKKPLPYKSIEGIEHIDKVINIDQTPIGRTPRSNPATYTGVLSEIRMLFAHTPEAKIRGYKSGRFSFNLKGGRCEECKGGGLKVIEMNFLPNVYVKCEVCQGKRFNKETLEIKYKRKSICDVLEMTVNTAVDFF